MGVYNRNAGRPGRKPLWYVRYWVHGEEIREPGKQTYKTSATYLAEFKRQIREGTWVHPNKRRRNHTRYDDYARTVIGRRTARGIGASESPPNKTEIGHVENHLIPAFGKLQMSELGFKAIKDGFDQHINSKDLGGRTVRNIHSTHRSILIEAAEDGLIDFPPPPLSVKRDQLPPPIDKKEGWRSNAKFDGDEIARLAETTEIVSLRRVMYLTYFFTGSRFAEIVDLKVAHYNRERRPLHCLSVRALKVGRHKGRGRLRREVPVHPELQAWLDWWLAVDYVVLYGHAPRPEDLLFPNVSVRRRNRGLESCSHNEIYKQWTNNDLPAAGLRHRKLHDARRTLLSALKNAGVPDDLRRKITHHSVEDAVLDAYTIWEWETLCDAMRKIRWNIPKPGRARKPKDKVVQLGSGTRRK